MFSQLLRESPAVSVYGGNSLVAAGPDPTMCEADTILKRFGNRLQQIHLSLVNSRSVHEPLNHESILAFRRVAHLLPESTPIILETPVGCDGIEREIEKVAWLVQ